MKTRIFLALFCLFSLISCEGYIYTTGTVYFQKEHRPVDSAQVILLMHNRPADTVYTDVNGKFDLKKWFGGFPKPKLLFHKSGYTPVELDFKKERKTNPGFRADSVEVYLVRNKQL